MAGENIAVVLSEPASTVLRPAIEFFKTIDWTYEPGKSLVCVLCEEVDFSGALAKLHIVPKREGKAFEAWLPHGFIVMAFDFSPDRPIGFLQAKT
ncbi:MAG TPA: hypothetical protein VD965_01715 [Burkholderiales bacterium]|nr:hypothetical protein [Burkholderiales bacterium]